MRAKYAPAHVGVVQYSFEKFDIGNRITRIEVLLLNGERKDFEGAEALSALFEWSVCAGVNMLYVWDFYIFGMFCDTWALRSGIPQYSEDIKKNEYGQVQEECWSALYSGNNGILNFRYTGQRTHRVWKHENLRVGGFHQVEVRGLCAYYGSRHRAEISQNLGIVERDTVEELKILLDACAEGYEAVTGTSFFDPQFVVSTYSPGGAGQQLYLKLRYNKTRKAGLKAYQKEHPQSEAVEDYYRQRKLLLGGICYANRRLVGTLLLSRANTWRKYDANGLYSSVCIDAGELGEPEESDFETFKKDKSGEYAYIITVYGLTMFLKPHRAEVFNDPFTADQSSTIMIENEYALWGELWEALEEYYYIEEYKVINVMRCKKRADPAMAEYMHKVLDLKAHAKIDNNKPAYLISKIFANALLGRFSQHHKYTTFEPFYDKEQDIVLFRAAGWNNEWEPRHFDYLRGSYIYTLARVKVMIDALCALGDDMQYSWAYTDTDSIVTNKPFPAAMLDATASGKYKVEETYQCFGIVCKKCYYGRNVAGEDCYTLAGIPKRKFLEYIHNTFPSATPRELFEYIKNDSELSLEVRTRARGGGGVVVQPFRLGRSIGDIVKEWLI